MQLSKYIIRRWQDETQCDWCGYPLYIGDVAYMDTSNKVYCGKKCQEKYLERKKLNNLRKEKQRQ